MHTIAQPVIDYGYQLESNKSFKPTGDLYSLFYRQRSKNKLRRNVQSAHVNSRKQTMERDKKQNLITDVQIQRPLLRIKSARNTARLLDKRINPPIRESLRLYSQKYSHVKSKVDSNLQVVYVRSRNYEKESVKAPPDEPKKDNVYNTDFNRHQRRIMSAVPLKQVYNEPTQSLNSPSRAKSATYVHKSNTPEAEEHIGKKTAVETTVNDSKESIYSPEERKITRGRSYSAPTPKEQENIKNATTPSTYDLPFYKDKKEEDVLNEFFKKDPQVSSWSYNLNPYSFHYDLHSSNPVSPKPISSRSPAMNSYLYTNYYHGNGPLLEKRRSQNHHNGHSSEEVPPNQNKRYSLFPQYKSDKERPGQINAFNIVTDSKPENDVDTQRKTSFERSPPENDDLKEVNGIPLESENTDMKEEYWKDGGKYTLEDQNNAFLSVEKKITSLIDSLNISSLRSRVNTQQVRSQSAVYESHPVMNVEYNTVSSVEVRPIKDRLNKSDAQKNQNKDTSLLPLLNEEHWKHGGANTMSWDYLRNKPVSRGRKKKVRVALENNRVYVYTPEYDRPRR